MAFIEFFSTNPLINSKDSLSDTTFTGSPSKSFPPEAPLQYVCQPVQPPYIFSSVSQGNKYGTNHDSPGSNVNARSNFSFFIRYHWPHYITRIPNTPRFHAGSHINQFLLEVLIFIYRTLNQQRTGRTLLSRITKN